MLVRVKHFFPQQILLASLLAGSLQSIASALPTVTDSIATDSTPDNAPHPLALRAVDLPPLGTSAPYLPALDTTIHLVLRLEQRRVFLYEGDRVLASYSVAIGRSTTPTPLGEYAVFQMIENPVWQSPWTGEVAEPGPDSALGLRWIGFARVTGGVIGFHGTPTLASIGRAASHGCVRMRNEDVVQLFDQIEVGTPVVVEP